MLEIFSAGRILEHGTSNSWEFRRIYLGCWALTVCRPLVEETTTSTCWGNCVESVVCWSCHGRTCDRRMIMHIVITSWTRIFTHFLHFFHVWESLLSRVETIRRIFFLETDIFLIFDNCSRTIFLEGESKSWLGGIIKSLSRWCLILWCLLVVASVSHYAICVWITLKSPRGRTEDSTLMFLSLVLMVLNSLQEGTPPHFNIFVFHWNHLVEVNRLPFVLRLWSLVFKSHLTRTKRLQVVASA